MLKESDAVSVTNINYFLFGNIIFILSTYLVELFLGLPLFISVVTFSLPLLALSYIINNYEQLPDNIWFVQGNPFDHSPDFLNLMSENVIQNYIQKKLVEEEGKCELTAAENFLKDI